MSQPYPFSAFDLTELQTIFQAHTLPQARFRAAVLLRLAAGERVSTVAATLEITRRTVATWHDAWLGAGVAALTRPFPLPKVSADHRQRLEVTLAQDREGWTLPSLRDDWRQQTGVHLRLTAFTALLGDLGYYSLPTIEPMPWLYRASRNDEERQAFTAEVIEQLRERWWW